MSTWLVEHAVDNAWQFPGGDNGLTIQLQKMSADSGIKGNMMVMGSVVKLPFDDWGHLFFAGDGHPSLGKLNIPHSRWLSLSTVVNTFNLNVLIYGESGGLFPLGRAYIARHRNGGVMIALPQMDIYDFIDTEEVYFKITLGYRSYVDGSYSKSVTHTQQQISSDADRYTLAKKYEALAAEGWVEARVNGIPIYDLVESDMSRWDDVELITDSSIRYTQDFPVSDLTTFKSALDSVRKYLIHLDGKDRYSFVDDIELYFVHNRKGTYYPHHLSKSLRQVTYNDIAIPTARINSYLETLSVGVDSSDISIRVVVRNDNLDRDIVFNSSRTSELYKLDGDKIVQAMTGANSTLTEWQASNLESSYINQLAYSKYTKIDTELVANAYGYNSMSYYGALTPQKTYSTDLGPAVKLPHILMLDSTIYEYDSDGVMLTHYHHTATVPQLICKNSNCAYVEAIYGEAKDSFDVDYDSVSGQLDTTCDHKMYKRVLKSGVVTNEFEEAVADTDYTLDDNGYLTWSIDTDRRKGVVFSNKTHYYKELELDVSDGLLSIGLTDTIDGSEQPMCLGVETVEVWLNDHPLVEGVDFKVDQPKVVIAAKRFTIDGKNKIAIRARGIRPTYREASYGFVINSLFSDNTTFDVKDDKVVRIVAGGRLVGRDDCAFREDTTVGTDIVPDGTPYSIGDPTVPLKTIADVDTFALQDADRDLDTRVEDYMTTYLPTPQVSSDVAISSYYEVFSPVLNKIIWDWLEGRLVLEQDSTGRISDEALDEYMENYKYLLEYDLAYVGFDERFVQVHPHSKYEVITVSEQLYAFVERVNHRYLNSAVVFNKYLKIGSNS